MGYSFWELYTFRRLPRIRWRGDIKQHAYGEVFPNNLSVRNAILKRVAYSAIALSIPTFTGVFYYYILKREGLLHLLHSDWFGLDQVWDRVVMSGIRSHLREERAYRQLEAYKKTLELREQEIMKQYQCYEEKKV